MTRESLIATYRHRIAQNQHQRLSQQELDRLISGFIETLIPLNSEIEIQQQCKTEIQLLEEGYPQSTLATKYLSRYRKAIQQAIEQNILPLTPATSHQYQHQNRHTGAQSTRTEHWALTYLKYSPATYQTLDNRQSKINRSKQLNLRQVPLEQYLQTLQTLLGDPSPRNQAIAIAGLTGRRIGEVLARGTFNPTDHPYLLHFEGHQKTERAAYNILTLIPAADILSQIEPFRQHPEIQPITHLTGEPLKTAINQFDVQINRLCNRHLGQTHIIPALANKKNVTVHNLRSLWGAIAVHLFCPDQYHEYAFVQHYLGHTLDSGATSNYLRYQLIDTQSNPLRTKGILLNQISPLPLIEDIEPDLDIAPPETTAMTQPPDPAPSTLTETDLHHLRAEWQQTLNQTITALRTDLEHQLKTQLLEIQQPPNIKELRTRIATLEQQNKTLAQDHNRAIAQLQTEKETLTQQLKQAQDKLERFRQLLNSNDPPEIEPQPAEQTHQAKQPQPNKPAIAPEPASEIAPEPISKPRGPHPGKAFQRAETIVLAIKDWNRLHPHETFAINAGLLETVFRVHRQAVKTFLETYQNELWEYHQDLGVESPRWHNRGKDTQKLKTFVTQTTDP